MTFVDWTLGKAHFFSMNSETAIDTANFSDKDMEWLSTTLKTVDRYDTR